MKALRILFLILGLALATPGGIADVQAAGNLQAVKIAPLELGMTEPRARKLLTRRNFREQAPGDYRREDGEGRFTRMQYRAEEGKLNYIRLYLESKTGYTSALNGYLSNIDKALGAPDERRAGQDQRDPLVDDLYRDADDDSASLRVKIARGEEKFAALMTLQSAGTGQARPGSVAELALQGFRLGMTQDELAALAQSRGMTSSNARNYRSSGQPDLNVRWTTGSHGAERITLEFGGIGRQDPRKVPEIKALLDKIDAALGADQNGNRLSTKVFKYTFADGFDRDAPKLEVILKNGMAHFHLSGDPSYQPPEVGPLAELALDPGIVAQAETAMQAQAAMPDPIVIDEAAVAGIRLGMSKEEAAAAAGAAGYEQRRADAYSRETDAAYHNVNLDFDDNGQVVKVTEQIKPTGGSFDVAAEQATLIATYGRPSQAMDSSPQRFSGLFREDSETLRKELSITVRPIEKYLRLQQRER